MLTLCSRSRPIRVSLFCGLAVLLSACASGTPRDTSVSRVSRAATPDERRTATRFESLRNSPQEQWAFLKAMPKGADLHTHLAGTVYAESMIDWAAEDGLCVDAAMTVVSPPCDARESLRPVGDAHTDEGLRRDIINAWSTRDLEHAGHSGHRQFFDTFGKFSAATRGNRGRMLAEAVSRAADGGVLYLEVMETLDNAQSIGIGAAAGRHGDLSTALERLRDAGIAEAVTAARANRERAEAVKDSLLGCGTEKADPGCSVTVRWLYQVLREHPPAQVFAQILTGFLLAEGDDRVVGVNLVQPEDGHYAMRDYRLHMNMIGFLRERHPGVRITLHAGELAPGLVPPEGLTFHIRDAILRAGAERIGHGVAVMQEDDPYGLLELMRERDVLVEICLTSNATILGVSGEHHPLRVYHEHGVAVALATDDEGVSRSEMTAEYLRAARDQGLGYLDLKEMARNSLEYAFVEEEEKARLVEELEKRFGEFERIWN